MLIRTYIGVSLDGFMAMADGLPAWEAIPNFDPRGHHGYPQLMEQCDAVILGRTSLDQGVANWPAWPWPGKQVYVLTSSPLPAGVPDGVIGFSEPAKLLEAVRGSGIKGDVLLLGGARTFQAFQALGAIDRVGVCFVPAIVGAGTRMFAPSVDSTFKLESQHSDADGTVELVYAPAS